MTFNVIYPAAPACSRVDSFASAHSGIRAVHRPALGAGSKLVVLVFEQDVERGERSVTARDVLLQIELVRFAQFAWNAIASTKAGCSRSPPTQGNATLRVW